MSKVFKEGELVKVFCKLPYQTTRLWNELVYVRHARGSHTVRTPQFEEIEVNDASIKKWNRQQEVALDQFRDENINDLLSLLQVAFNRLLPEGWQPHPEIEDDIHITMAHDNIKIMARLITVEHEESFDEVYGWQAIEYRRYPSPFKGSEIVDGVIAESDCIYQLVQDVVKYLWEEYSTSFWNSKLEPYAHTIPLHGQHLEEDIPF